MVRQKLSKTMRAAVDVNPDCPTLLDTATGVRRGDSCQNPTMKITRVLGQPDPSKVREFPDDVRDGKFCLLVPGCGCVMRLRHTC
jgi:hypothetical protein